MEKINHEYFMSRALQLAEVAATHNEIPIAALLVAHGKIIARAYNQIELLNDTTAHAEMIVITAATQYLKTKFLKECTLYVTVEPCPMCATLCKMVQLKQLVYAASEKKTGYTNYSPCLLHPKTTVIAGLLQQQAVELMNAFFIKKR